MRNTIQIWELVNTKACREFHFEHNSVDPLSSRS